MSSRPAGARGEPDARRRARPARRCGPGKRIGRDADTAPRPDPYETLDDARRGIGGYVDRYHHRPHSGLDYKTPYEVKQTWEDLQNIAA